MVLSLIDCVGCKLNAVDGRTLLHFQGKEIIT